MKKRHHTWVRSPELFSKICHTAKHSRKILSESESILNEFLDRKLPKRIVNLITYYLAHDDVLEIEEEHNHYDYLIEDDFFLYCASEATIHT